MVLENNCEVVFICEDEQKNCKGYKPNPDGACMFLCGAECSCPQMQNEALLELISDAMLNKV